MQKNRRTGERAESAEQTVPESGISTGPAAPWPFALRRVTMIRDLVVERSPFVSLQLPTPATSTQRITLERIEAEGEAIDPVLLHTPQWVCEHGRPPPGQSCHRRG